MKLLRTLTCVIILEVLLFFSMFDLFQACTDCPEACRSASCSTSGSASLSYYVSESYRESYSTTCNWWERCRRYRQRSRRVRRSCTVTCCSGYSVQFGECRSNESPVPLNIQVAPWLPLGSVKVTWTIPNDLNRTPVTGYSVQYRIISSAGYTTLPTIFGRGATSQLITDLNTATQYSVRVASVNEFGMGSYSNEVQATTHGIEVSEPVQMLTYHVISDTTAVIRWSEPNESNGIILGYKVKVTVYQEDNIHTLENTTSVQLLLWNLARHTPYEVTVLTITHAGNGIPSSIVFFTMEGVPASPLNSVEVDQLNDTIQVKWKGLTLSEAKGFPYYIVSYASDDGNITGTINTTNSSALFKGLDPKRGFLFIVQTATGYGNGLATAKYLKISTAESNLDLKFNATVTSNSPTYAAIGSFIGGTFLGVFATLLLIGIVMVVYKLRRKYGSGSIVHKERNTATNEPDNTYEAVERMPTVQHDGNFILMEKNLAYSSVDFTKEDNSL